MTQPPYCPFTLSMRNPKGSRVLVIIIVPGSMRPLVVAHSCAAALVENTRGTKPPSSVEPATRGASRSRALTMAPVFAIASMSWR